MDAHLMLALAEGCGPGVVSALLDPSRDPAELLRDPPADLPPACRRRLNDRSLASRAAEVRHAARRLGVQIVTPVHDDYPERLRYAPSRPATLFARGDPAAWSGRQPAVAIVGSRTPTPYGEAAARDFGAALGRAGVVVWSGLAYGIDALAHRSCTAAGGRSVAVLAGGLDRIEPTGNEGLGELLMDRAGALLSESPPGRRPSRGHFPRRNRILAWSVDAVLVVEAGLASGSLHTARFAAEHGVPVFAVPGPYTSTRSRGCHQLLADGAAVAVDPADLLRELGVLQARDPADTSDGSALDLQGDAAALFAALESGPRPADLLRRETGLEQARFLTALLDGCERGLLLQLPGDLIARGASG